jgi:hypothetical protein
MYIQDGKGQGYVAQVDNENRVRTQSVSETEALHNLELGNNYNINTGLISITGDATLLYIKNNEDKDLIVEALALAMADGNAVYSDDPYLTIVRNPTGGDLISDKTAVSMNQNRNFGSTQTLTADVYKGKVSGTLTGGNDLAILQASSGGRAFYTIDLLLPKGSSVGIKLTANMSSGASNTYIAAITHLKSPTT